MYCMYIVWVPARQFLCLRSRFYSLEIVKLLLHVTEKPKDMCLKKATSIPESPEDVYPLLRLSISTPISVWLIFVLKKVCQNILKIDKFICSRVSYASYILCLLI